MKKILLLFLLCNCILHGFSQYKLQLHYDTITPREERIVQKINLKKSYSSSNAIENDLKKIAKAFHKEQYASFSIDTLIQDSLVYTAYLFFGQPLIIHHLEVQGLTEGMYTNIKRPSPPLSMQDVFKHCEVILNYLENTGYPFASVRFDRFEKDSLETRAIISVSMNQYIVWDSIILKGNAKLARSFMSAYFDIKAGKPYKENVVRQFPSLIHTLAFIEETQTASVSFSEDKAALYLYLNKRNTNQFDGFLGVIPENSKSGKTLITGNINLLLNNTMTLGERISLQWNTPDNLSQNFDIDLTFPYLFYSRFGVDLNFHLQKTDTSYLLLNVTPGLQYYFKGTNYLKLYYQYNNTRLIATKHLQEITVLPDHIDFDLHLYGLEIFYRELDYVFNPRKGYSLFALAAIGKRSIIINNNIPAELYQNIDGNSLQIRSQADFSFYLPIKKRWTYLIRLQGAHLYSPELFENELFRIGGLKTLRGFIEQSIYASSYCIVNTEIRFLFTKNSFAHAFFDAGWYEKKTKGSYMHDFPFSFGLGVAFDTKAGIFSLNYALGRQRDNPISLKTGIVSFGYIAVF